MAKQLMIGFISEGSTDVTFLPNIIEKAFMAYALEATQSISIDRIEEISISKTGKAFVALMLEASQKAVEQGFNVLCIHVDADARDRGNVWKHKFEPFFEKLAEQSRRDHCHDIIPIIPVQMTEAWMLADKETLKEQMKAKKRNDTDLKIEKFPEDYADPKEQLKEAIRIAQSGKTKRQRSSLSIQELYEILPGLISLDELRKLPSFVQFEEDIRQTLWRMGYR
jgi:hypothetical protein